MAVHADLLIWYHFDTATGGKQSLASQLGLGPALTQSGSGHSFDSERGLVLDGADTSDIEGALTSEQITAIEAGGSMYLRLDLTSSSSGTRSGFRLSNSTGTQIAALGNGNGSGTLFVSVSGQYAQKGMSGFSLDTQIIMAMYWAGVASIGNMAADGVLDGVQDTTVDDISSITRVLMGNDQIGQNLKGGIREARYYSSVDGGTGDPDQWILDLSSGLITESVATAGSAFAFARSTLSRADQERRKRKRTVF